MLAERTLNPASELTGATQCAPERDDALPPGLRSRTVDVRRPAGGERRERDGEAGDPEAAEEPAAEYIGGPVHPEVNPREADEEHDERRHGPRRGAQRDGTG